jgi:aminobenzoyl-glutamate transport protein
MILSWVASGAGWTVQKKQSRQAFELLTDAQGAPLIYEPTGEARVRLLYEGEGAQRKPKLELVADSRQVKRIMVPAAEVDGAAATQPATDQAVAKKVPLRDAEGRPVVVVTSLEEQPLDVIRPVNLLTADGLYWCLSSMVENFMNFPPLGVVLVGMLGIGVAERTGMLEAGLKAFVLLVPRFLLTPAIVFIGLMSSMGIDAGYVVLPPLAAALYQSIGRSPLVGVAAAFAGVSAGFNANLLITGLDPLLAGFTTTGAQVIDPNYVVAPTCNWWFLIASTFVMTITGWLVTGLIVDPRFRRKTAEDGGPRPLTADEEAALGKHSFLGGLGLFGLIVVYLVVAAGPLVLPQSPLNLLNFPALQSGGPVADWFMIERPLWQYVTIPVVASVVILPLFTYVLARPGLEKIQAVALAWATGVLLVIAGGVVLLAVTPGTLLYGPGERFARWVEAIVPIIFFVFVLPGIVYGLIVRRLTSGRDIAKMMVDAMAAMAPIIVLAFFAAQFIEYFQYAHLDQMLAQAGGQMLAAANMPLTLLVVAFIGVTIVFNLFVGSMSAKYAMFAPIFVPMFMMIGIAPELTQAAYRIGDSVSNVITPLNSYLIIVLVYIQRFVPKAGMGTLISMMMPYTVVFAIVWTIMLVAWIQFGWELGPYGPLTYNPFGG